MSEIDKSLWTEEHHRYADPNYKYGTQRNQKQRRTQCRWETKQYNRSWPNYHQCVRSPTHDGLWCGTHRPEAVAAREAKKKRKLDEKELAYQLKRWQRNYERAILDALDRIAEDPSPYNNGLDYLLMLREEWLDKKPTMEKLDGP